MDPLRRLRRLIQKVTDRDRVEKELDAELRFHVESEAERHMAAGSSPDQARRAAVVSFGGVEGVKEGCRDAWGLRFFETLGQDLRYGLRSLLRNPTYSAVVVLTLGLGIGANTAVFSVVRGVLLRPLPYARGEEVVALRQSVPRDGLDDLGFSPLEVGDYRDTSQTLADVVEYHSMTFTLLGGPEPQRVRTGVVSAGFFDLLGVKPLIGRGFRAGEDAVGAEPVLLLSHSFWRDRLGGDPGLVGRSFEMNDRMHAVVGVLPPLPGYPEENDVYMPVSACPFRNRSTVTEDRTARMLRAFARVKPGTPFEQVRAELASLAQRFQAQYPDAYPKETAVVPGLVPVREEMVSSARPTFLVLLGTVALVLLTACANVANLSLARLADRGRELAVRAALGAGRRRLLRQLLTESTLLALLGGALGLLVAFLAHGALVAFAARFTPRAEEIRIDAAVLAFALGVTTLAGLLVGALPGLPAFERLARVLSSEGRSTAGPARQRLRGALVVSQLALSFMLVIGAALMLRSFAKLRKVDPGFRTENVLTLTVDLNWGRTPHTGPGQAQEQVLRVMEPLWDEVATLPGVVSLGSGWTFPLNSSFRSDGTLLIEGRPIPPGGSAPRVEFRGASPGYFDVIGVPILRGRAFDARDRGDLTSVAVVSRGLALRHWGSDDPLGQRVSFDQGKTWRSIVGVAGDVRQAALREDPADTLYVPFAQFPGFTSTLFVRTHGDPRVLARTLRQRIHALDPQAAVSGVRTLEEIRSESLSSPRLTTVLLGAFAALALAISAAGLYGVLAYSVSQRTREIGIRMALGAAPERVRRMLIGQGLASVGLGVGMGLLGALGVTRLVAGLLFGIDPTDPLCFVGSTLVLLAVALLACLVPARRATAVQPMVALRAD